MRVFIVSFEVETNLSAEAIKSAVLDVIGRGDLELENRLEEVAEIDTSTVTVRDEDHQLPEVIFDATRGIGPVTVQVECDNMARVPKGGE